MTIDFLELLTTGVVGNFQGGESKEEVVNLITLKMPSSINMEKFPEKEPPQI